MQEVISPLSYRVSAVWAPDGMHELGRRSKLDVEFQPVLFITLVWIY